MTPRQQQVLDHVREYIATHGWSPSMGEIAEALGTSRPNATGLVNTLVADGWLVRPSRKWRSLALPRVPELRGVSSAALRAELGRRPQCQGRAPRHHRSRGERRHEAHCRDRAGRRRQHRPRDGGVRVSGFAPAGWQKGSFRGVAFITQEHEESGGRRGTAHEFPLGEVPVWEDLGRKAGAFSLTCHVLGAPDASAADALRAALRRPGPGTLIHPWYGSMQVAVDGFTRRDSTSEGGMSSFTIDFIESGLPAVVQATADTSAQAKAIARQTTSAASSRFDKAFSVAKATAFVERAAARLVSAAALATSLQGGLLGGAGPALRAFQAGLGALGGADVLVRNGLDLGLATIGLVQTLSVLGSSGGARIAALGALLRFGDDLPPVTGATPARAIERANQAAYVQLVNLAAASELVGVVAVTSFASYQDAVGVRDAVAAEYDRLALRQADAGDRDGAQAYDDLRRALVRDVTARGGSLARLQAYTPATTEPALAIAARLYDDPAQIAVRAAEITARNRVPHPGFVPGGVPLQVLTPDLPAGGARA